MLDETYVKVKGESKYYYRAVNKQGNTIEFLLTAKRDTKATLCFFNKAIGLSGKPGLINMFNQNNNRQVKNRQCKCLNNIVKQDRRRVKRVKRLMLSFKSFHSAQSTLAGIELVAMLKKGQMKKNVAGAMTPAEQFYALAA